jgi:HJR/Mrr/RecB family endonuclease
MGKNKKDKDLEEVLSEFYFLLKFKLKFDDIQASTTLASILLLPTSYYVGIMNNYDLLTRVFYITLVLDLLVIIYSFIKVKYLKDFRIKEEKNKVDIYKIKNINQVDVLSGLDFERVVEQIYLDMGYTTTQNQASYDWGADIIARKGKEVICIQCKRSNKTISKFAVFEAYHSIEKYSAKTAVVATNNKLSPTALLYARELNVEIFDRDKIIRYFQDKL